MLTTYDFDWLVKVLASVIFRYVGIGVQEDAYKDFENELAYKYGNFDRDKFRIAFNTHMVNLGKRPTG